MKLKRVLMIPVLVSDTIANLIQMAWRQNRSWRAANEPLSQRIGYSFFAWGLAAALVISFTYGDRDVLAFVAGMVALFVAVLGAVVTLLLACIKDQRASGTSPGK